jgi:hypothetical protein
MWLLQVAATKWRKKFGPHLSASRCFAPKMLTQMEIVCTAEIQRLHCKPSDSRSTEPAFSKCSTDVEAGRTDNGTPVVETGNDRFRSSLMLFCRQEEVVFFLRATHFALTTMLWLSSIRRRGMKVSKTQLSYC